MHHQVKAIPHRDSTHHKASSRVILQQASSRVIPLRVSIHLLALHLEWHISNQQQQLSYRWEEDVRSVGYV